MYLHLHSLLPGITYLHILNETPVNIAVFIVLFSLYRSKISFFFHVAPQKTKINSGKTITLASELLIFMQTTLFSNLFSYLRQITNSLSLKCCSETNAFKNALTGKVTFWNVEFSRIFWDSWAIRKFLVAPASSNKYTCDHFVMFFALLWNL